MRVLAVIPARGGSRGVPRKNIRPLGGRPLLAWSVEAAFRSSLVTDVAVSTEDPEITGVAAEALRWESDQEKLRLGEARLQADYGGAAPPEPKLWGTIARPAELATDEAPTDPVLIHASYAAGLGPEDLVVTLQPTSPFRAPWLVDACIRKLVDEGLDCVATMRPAGLAWVWDEVKGLRGLCPRKRRQDWTPEETVWAEDGSVYVTTVWFLRTWESRVGGRQGRVETDGRDHVDIDTERDWWWAERFYEAFWRAADTRRVA